jgi:hypothetical protein
MKPLDSSGWVMTARLIIVVAFAILAILPLRITANAKEFEDYAKTLLINQPESSVTINSYKAWYRDRAKQTFADLLAYGKEKAPIREAGYNWAFNYTNTGGKDIVALQINVLAINAFWEYADTFAVFQGAYFIPGKTVEKSGMLSFNEDIAALYYALWVDKVLFADGTVWKTDLAYLTGQIQDGFNIQIEQEWLTPGESIEMNRDTGRQPVQ